MNIAEILKNAPKGTMLYSPLYGEVALLEVHDPSTYVHKDACIEVMTGNREDVCFYTNGKPLCYGLAPECLLFPSKENRNWSKFRLYKQFEPFQRVLVHTVSDCWTADFYSHFDGEYHVTVSCIKVPNENILPYEGNEDKLGKEI